MSHNSVRSKVSDKKKCSQSKAIWPTNIDRKEYKNCTVNVTRLSREYIRNALLGNIGVRNKEGNGFDTQNLFDQFMIDYLLQNSFPHDRSVGKWPNEK